MDFHCHLDLYEDPKTVIQRTVDAGIYTLSVTTTPKAFPGTKKLAKNAPRIRTALGLHPQLAAQRINELGLFDLILPEVAYVGEVGLDGSRDFQSTLSIQLTAFQHILKSCSNAGGKVLSVHSRSAASLVLDEISEHLEHNTAIFHWFSGSHDELKRASDMGCWFSIGPSMLKSKKGRMHIKNMPPDRVLLETDGPFSRLNGLPLEPIHTLSALDNLSDVWEQNHSNTEKQMRQNLTLISNIANNSIVDGIFVEDFVKGGCNGGSAPLPRCV